MAREPENFVCYALPPTDDIPYEHVGHFIEGYAPEGARAIDAVEAKRIHDDVDARTPPASAISAQLAASVDLKPLLDKIDALSKTVVSQAEALDAANEKIEAQGQDISQVRKNTAKAIAQMTEGIGENKG